MNTSMVTTGAILLIPDMPIVHSLPVSGKVLLIQAVTKDAAITISTDPPSILVL